MSAPLSPSYRKIAEVVAKIPRGKVMTYGQVAKAAGLPGAARLVGYAMHAIGRRLPWQRVLGQKRPGVARISHGDERGAMEQRLRLEAEGVGFGLGGTIDLARYGHAPRKIGRAKG